MVRIKGKNWKWGEGYQARDGRQGDIELIPPSGDEIGKLKKGDTVLMAVMLDLIDTSPVTRISFRPLNEKSYEQSIVSILPSPEPQRELLEIPEKLKETPSPFCYTDTLTPNINKIIDCLHAILEKIKRLENK